MKNRIANDLLKKKHVFQKNLGISTISANIKGTFRRNMYHKITGKFFKWYLTGNYMFKVINRNIRTGCEIYSKLTIKTPERRQVGAFYIWQWVNLLIKNNTFCALNWPKFTMNAMKRRYWGRFSWRYCETSIKVSIFCCHGSAHILSPKW